MCSMHVYPLFYFLYHIKGVLSRVRAAEGNARATGGGNGRRRETGETKTAVFGCHSVWFVGRGLETVQTTGALFVQR